MDFFDFKTNRVETLYEHRQLLKKVFETAQRRILIVSPFLTSAAILEDDVCGMIRKAKARGVTILIYADYDLNRVDRHFKKSVVKAVTLLHRAGVNVTFVNGIHNKTLAKDDDFIAEGSFNWLSAVRKEGGMHQREERTLVNEGKTAKWDIDREIAGMDRKIAMARSEEIVSAVGLDCKGDGKEDKGFGAGKSILLVLVLVVFTGFSPIVMLLAFLGWFCVLVSKAGYSKGGPFDKNVKEYGPKERELSDVEKLALGIADAGVMVGSCYSGYTGYRGFSDDDNFNSTSGVNDDPHLHDDDTFKSLFE